jgi:protein-L-isoaspartate(D-aspartate) O-methyltransferase
MNNFQNDCNLSNKKSGFSRLIIPSVIILPLIILGLVVFLFPPDSFGNPRATVGTQQGTAKSPVSIGASSDATRKTNQFPIFDITKRLDQPPMNNEADYIQWMLANTPEKKNYLTPKWERLQAIIEKQDVNDPRIIEAFLRAPREFFCDAGSSSKAYANAVMPIGYGQTISGPHLVSRMTQTINPQPSHKVLEIGTGSGYQSAILAELSNYVYTIEIVPQLAEKANAVYTKQLKNYPEYANIKRKAADGYYGWAEYAPFDRIIVTAGIDHVPPDLLKQLAPGGIMVIPVGPPSGQTVLKISKEVLADGSVTFKREDIYHGRKVVFVPFTAGQGIHSTTNDKIQQP